MIILLCLIIKCTPMAIISYRVVLFESVQTTRVNDIIIFVLLYYIILIVYTIVIRTTLAGCPETVILRHYRGCCTNCTANEFKS